MSKKGYLISAQGENATIYLYGGIDTIDDEGFLVDRAEFIKEVAAIKAPQIDVRIASVGGDPLAAGEMYQALIDHPAKVRTIVDSKAYSAGSMLLQAGDERIARPMSMIMVHGPGSKHVHGRGSAADHREMAEVIEAHAEAMVPAYTRHGIDADTVRGWFASDKDIYFDAQAALDANLIDSVVESMPLSASAPGEFRIAAMGGKSEIAADGRATTRTADMADNETSGNLEGAPETLDITARHSATVKAADTQGRKAEAQRVKTIKAVFDGFYDGDPLNPITAVHDDCVSDIACDELEARRKLQAALAARSADPIIARQQYGLNHQPSAPPNVSRHIGGALQISSDQADLRAAGLSKALQIKAGLILDRAEIEKERKGEFLSMSLTDIMAQEMRAAGYTVGGMREDIARAYTRALPVLAAGPSHGTDHLPAVLGNIANLSAMQGWDASDETWQQWTQSGTLNNYQTATRANTALLDKLQLMQENQEWEYGDMADVKQRITAYFHGLKYSLSLQALANDELGELTRTMNGWGESASATVGDYVYALLTTSGTGGLGQVMDEDSKVLFHADHGNYVASGSGAVPTEALLNAGRAAMVAQADQNSRKVAVRPQYVIHGPALWSTVRKVLNSEELQEVSVDGATGATVLSGSANTAREMNLTPIEEYRFTANQWILAAARRTIEVAGVGGPVTPRAEQAMVSNTPGITYELSMPFGAAVLDYRGLRYNHGA